MHSRGCASVLGHQLVVVLHVALVQELAQEDLAVPERDLYGLVPVAFGRHDSAAQVVDHGQVLGAEGPVILVRDVAGIAAHEVADAGAAGQFVAALVQRVLGRLVPVHKPVLLCQQHGVGLAHERVAVQKLPCPWQGPTWHSRTICLQPLSSLVGQELNPLRSFASDVTIPGTLFNVGYNSGRSSLDAGVLAQHREHVESTQHELLAHLLRLPHAAREGHAVAPHEVLAAAVLGDGLGDRHGWHNHALHDREAEARGRLGVVAVQTLLERHGVIEALVVDRAAAAAALKLLLLLRLVASVAALVFARDAARGRRILHRHIERLVVAAEAQQREALVFGHLGVDHGLAEKGLGDGHGGGIRSVFSFEETCALRGKMRNEACSEERKSARVVQK
ncbi:hypothetical protein ON010_g10611 [Phytophthora cinnamomi]|nr:hypothetical protein ON010_g10611 [Phytophthora cinnamomi]